MVFNGGTHLAACCWSMDSSRSTVGGSPQAGSLAGDDALPSYAGRLLDLHEAHAAELRLIIDALPPLSGQHVLDVACGDGTFSRLMAERGASVEGLDVNPSYLELARRRGGSSNPRFVQGDALALPHPERVFDGAFCAQSFYSIETPEGVLAEMRRVVRPGGWVAVLENDTLHRMLLPWPPKLEMKLRLAEHEALSHQKGGGSKFYIGRHLIATMEQAGLCDVQERSFTTHRQSPIDPRERSFLQDYLEELLKRVRFHLEEDDYAELRQLTEPASDAYLLDAPNFSVTYLDMLAVGKTPQTRSP